MTVLQAQRRVDYLSREPAPRMGQVMRLGSGGLRIPAAFTRIGVFHYREGSDWVGELRSPEEVFAADSLASLRDVPLTLMHPDGAVTRDAWPLVARGHVCGDVHVDGIHVRGHAVATHPDLCSGIEGGELVELSCGYSADCEIVVGEWLGIPYQRIQRRIRYDHVAVGPRDWARGGSSVRLTLDGGAAHDLVARGRSFVALRHPGALRRPNRAGDRAGATMSVKFLREQRAVEVGGKQYDLTKPDQVAAATEAARVQHKRRTDAIDPAAAAMVVDELRGHLDVMSQLVMELAGSLVESDLVAEEALSPEQLDAAMEEYADCVSRAKRIKPDIATKDAAGKAKSIEQIQREALTARGFKHDGESDVYVAHAFKAISDTATFTKQDVQQMGAGAAGGQTQTRGESALSNAWKGKRAQKGASS